MFSTFNTLMVIVVLEAICCLYSITLAYLSDKTHLIKQDIDIINVK